MFFDKKNLSIKKVLMCFVCILAFLCVTETQAAEKKNVIAEGVCGDNISWFVTEELTLTIEGQGEIDDYKLGEDWIADVPWKNFYYGTKKVVISEGITRIGNYAFYSFENMESIVLPKSVKSVGDYAFAKCSMLENIAFPGNIEEMGAGVFADCTSLKTAEIPGTFQSVGESAFKNCDQLRKIDLPDTVTQIGAYAFSFCDEFREFKIPENVRSIGESAFYSCSLIGEIIIPEKTMEIGTYAFYGCYSLKNVEVKSKDLIIGGGAFSLCMGLSKITFEEGLKSIGNGAFSKCSELQEINIPNSVSDIGKNAFSECKSLKYIKIPSGVKIIKEDTFHYCHNLEEVILPDTIVSIEFRAFNNCEKLKKIMIPSSVESIGREVFYGGPKDFVIQCEANSVAHEFAMKNYYNYELTDVDLNSNVVTERFADVSVGKWYVDSIQYVFAQGVMTGDGYYFKPSENVTRAQFITTLYRLVESPKVWNYHACDVFSDVKEEKYYTDAICWAYNEGIATGNPNTGKFDTTGILTRQQLAAFLYRFAESKWCDTSARADISQMLNAENVSDYALESIKWAVGAGLISGSEKLDVNGNIVYDLAPHKGTTRAQLATILMRYCETYQ